MWRTTGSLLRHLQAEFAGVLPTARRAFCKQPRSVTSSIFVHQQAGTRCRLAHPATIHRCFAFDSRRYGAAAQLAADAFEAPIEEPEQFEGNTLEVDAAAVADESLKIVNCQLSPVTVNALERKGIHALFPIQKSVFDPAMAGTDLVARARTGSGKTLAFSLPIIESVLKEGTGAAVQGRGALPQAIILAPTRELAKQVATEMQSATDGRSVRIATVYGGTPIYSQIKEIEQGVDVLVGTPGRVIDLVTKRRVLQLSNIRFFVLDEADEMLNMGFQEDVENILESVPSSRQTMMFSATMPQWVRKLANKYCKNHITVDLVGEQDTGRVNTDVRCLACTVPPSLHAKRFLLVDLITIHSHAGKTIVFCNTKRECEAVVSAVSGIMPAEALHGDIAQDMREYTMNRFREGKTHVLVATDVAARGLDVNNVDLVVHWDVPSDSETYLHRSGRTGRAGNKGTAILMIGQRDKGKVADIMRDVKVDLELIGPPTPTKIIESAADNIKRSLKSTSTEVAKYFEGTAEDLLSNGIGDAKEPAEVLSVVMAQMSGYTELPKHKSLLGQQEDMVTLSIQTPKGLGFPTPGALIGSLRRITDEKIAASVGKVELFDDPEESGMEAAFDVPKEHVEAITSASLSNGATVTELKSLPLDLKKLRNHQGERGSQGRGRGRRNGGGYNGGGGYRNNGGHGRGSDRGGGGNYFDSRSTRGRGRGGYGGGYGNRDGGYGNRDEGYGGGGYGNRRYGKYRGKGQSQGQGRNDRREFNSSGGFDSW